MVTVIVLSLNYVKLFQQFWICFYSTRIGVIIDWTFLCWCRGRHLSRILPFLSWQNNNFKISEIEKLIFSILVCDPKWNHLKLKSFLHFIIHFIILKDTVRPTFWVFNGCCYFMSVANRLTYAIDNFAWARGHRLLRKCVGFSPIK